MAYPPVDRRDDCVYTCTQYVPTARRFALGMTFPCRVKQKSETGRCNDSTDHFRAAGYRIATARLPLAVAAVFNLKEPRWSSPFTGRYRKVAGWSRAEERLAGGVNPAPRATVTEARERIEAGEDPLGEAFCKLRSPAERRTKGATFTPRTDHRGNGPVGGGIDLPARIVDPGTGSGRYLVTAGRRIPKASLLGIEVDPLPAILARANLPSRAWPNGRK